MKANGSGELQECLQPLAAEHGREVIDFIIGLQMARMACDKLVEVISKHHSLHGEVALNMLAEEYNRVANAYMAEKAWSTAHISDLTESVGIALAGEVSPIILNS